MQRAAEFAKNNRAQFECSYIKIFCDSQAAIKAVNAREIRSRAVLEAIGALNELASVAKSVTIVWIKAHVNHIGNEKADMLAKNGAEGRGRNDFVLPPRILTKNKLQAASDMEWQQAWDAYPHARQTKLFLSKISSSFSEAALTLNRWSLSRIVSAITGHGPFNYHQHLLGTVDSSACRLCSLEPENFFHLLTVCPRLMSARLKIYGAHVLDLLNNNIEFTPSSMLEFISSTCLNDIFGNLEAPNRDNSTTSSDISSEGSSERA